MSLATASRVLNGSDRVVGEELQKRVLAVAELAGYVSHGPAQALAKATTNIVGLVIHDVNDPYFAAIASGAMDVARAHDLLLLVASAPRDPGLEAEYVVRLRAQRARGIVLAGSGFTDPKLAERVNRAVGSYTDSGGQVVFIGKHGVPDTDEVLPAHRSGAQKAASYLYKRGHRKIGVITGPLGLATVNERLQGFKSGLAKLGITLESDAIEEADFTRDGGSTATAALLDRHPDTTAIFALNDLMAGGAYRALEAMGRRIPDDVSVIGFDDVAIAQDLSPALTTVNLPLTKIGAEAMQLVIDGNQGESRTVRIPATLVERDSVADL